MSKKKTKKKVYKEPDSVFFLKIIMFFIIGSFWFRFGDNWSIPDLPVGLAIGLVFAHHDHFNIDRKLELVILLIAAIVGYFLPTAPFVFVN